MRDRKKNCAANQFFSSLLGFSLHVGGGLIHLLLVVGLVILVINLLSGRRSVV